MRKFIFFSIILFFASTASAETIKLKSGKVIEEVEVLERTDDYIKVDFQGVELIFYNDAIDVVMEDAEIEVEEIGTEVTRKTIHPEISFEAAEIKNAGNLKDSLKKSIDRMESSVIKHIFYEGGNEIARQKTDIRGNIIEQSGIIPDGVVKEYFENGQKNLEFNYVDNRPHGPAKGYYENGILYMIMNYKDGKLDGESKKYYENGKLFQEVNYKDSETHGIDRRYYEDGNLMAEFEFKSGKMNGPSKTYNKNGLLELEMNYKDGKAVRSRRYDENGNIVSERNYDN